MTRPVYETPEDRALERLATLVANDVHYFAQDVQQMTPRHPVDALYKDERRRVFRVAEFKARYYSRDYMIANGYMLGRRKYEGVLWGGDRYKAEPDLIVWLIDGMFVFPLRKTRVLRREENKGRWDRDDSLDVEDVVYLDMHDAARIHVWTVPPKTEAFVQLADYTLTPLEVIKCQYLNQPS